jgi:hypothetical protein
MTNTLAHIEAMQKTALALEAEARANGRYSRDCNRLNDALTRGQKRGVALLWGADGKLEVVDLNGGADHVHVSDEGEHVTVAHAEHHNPGPEEKRKNETNKIVEEASAPYKQMGGEEFASAASRSHQRGNETEGKFPPQSHHKAPTADAARLRQMTADAKAFTASQFERNRRIAEAQKARSREIHR